MSAQVQPFALYDQPSNWLEQIKEYVIMPLLVVPHGKYSVNGRRKIINCTL